MDGIFVVYQWNKLFAAFIFCFVVAVVEAVVPFTGVC